MERSQHIWQDIQAIREKNPLVHNITNYVVMNNTANALLAIGASPVMAHAIEELDEMVKIASALVINIGTLDNQLISSMYEALNAARDYKTPVILDPVGAGATKLRTKTVGHLLNKYKPDIICGNGSEIIAMAGSTYTTKGVDSLSSSDDAVESGKKIAERFDTTVIISGKIDYIINAEKTMKVHNGVEMMGRITGMGCTASALAGAFVGVNDSAFDAALGTMVTLGIAGEIGARDAKGPGSLQMYILDALYNLEEKAIQDKIRVK